MNIFDFTNYRDYLQAFLKSDEEKNPGARKRLLQTAGMSSSLLTQIFAEQKQLSQEHGYEVALHIGLSDKETDYFMLLLYIARAGSHKLQERLKFKAKQLQVESQKISSKIKVDVALTDEQKAIYYSSWAYTAVRNLIPTPHGDTIKDIALKLDLPINSVEQIVQFLLDIGLARKTNDELVSLAGNTHLDATSPLIFRHHQNWRQRAIHRMDHYNEKHLHYTCPMSLTKEGALLIRKKLLEDIKEINHLRGEHGEVAYCFNIDFFEY